MTYSVALAPNKSFEGVNIGLVLSFFEAEFNYGTIILFFAVDWNKMSVVPQVDYSYYKALNDKWLLAFGVGVDLDDSKAENFCAVDIKQDSK